MRTDNEVTAAFLAAARDKDHPGHSYANIIVKREHYRKIYQRNPRDFEVNPESANLFYTALIQEFGEDNIIYDRWFQKGSIPLFPVLLHDGSVQQSLDLSQTIQHLPVVAIEYIFASLGDRKQAEKWIENNREKIIRDIEEE